MKHFPCSPLVRQALLSALHTSRRRFLAGIVLAGLTGATSGQGAVWTVDDTGGADFIDIQEAVDAASDGDLILVREGCYSALTISGKSLTIQADAPPGTVEILNPFFITGEAISVSSITVGQQVVLRGLTTFIVAFTENEIASGVSDCDGPVLFEDCQLVNVSGIALEIDNAASVTLQRCTVDAGLDQYDAFINEYLQRTALTVTDAKVFLHETTVQGSLGPDAQQQIFGPVSPPGAGGIGILAASNVQLSAFGSTITGGAGGSGTVDFCFDGRDGGDAIRCDATCTVRLRDTLAQAGTGGAGGPGCGLADGVDGIDLNGPPASFETLTGTAHEFEITSPVRESENVTITYTGAPGDLAFLAVSDSLRPGFYLPARQSVLHMGPFLQILSLGPLPASGTRQLNILVPDLGTGVEALTFVCQMALLDSGGALSLTGPSSVIYLDQGL